MAKDIINSNIEPQELLLNVMFKTLYSKKIYEIITNWFQDKLRIIYHADKIHYAPNLESRIDIKNSNKKLFSNPQINEAVKEIGLTSEKIAYPITDKKDLIFPVSVIKTIDEKGIVVPAEFFESFIKLIIIIGCKDASNSSTNNVAPLFIVAIISGKISNNLSVPNDSKNSLIYVFCLYYFPPLDFNFGKKMTILKPFSHGEAASRQRFRSSAIFLTR